MNLPLELNQRVLNELASPSDTSATRVLLLSVANGGPARLSGKKRKYIFARDNEAGAHVLDVPDSLWQHDLPKGPYRENLSICHDLQNVMGAKVPLVFIRIPWGGDATPVSTPVSTPAQDAVSTAVILGYFRHIKAPEHVTEMLSKIAANPTEFIHYLEPPDEDTLGDTPATEEADETAPKGKSETPAAIRMREKRATATAARKRQLEPA